MCGCPGADRRNQDRKTNAPVNNKYSDKETAERVEIVFTYETLTVPSTQVKVSYLVFSDGNVRVRAHYYGKEGLPELPAFGIRFIIPKRQMGLSMKAYRARLIRTEKPEEFMVSMRWRSAGHTISGSAGMWNACGYRMGESKKK